MKALLLENVHPDATAYLQAAGIEVSTRHGALDERELSEALQGVQLLGIRSGTRVTASASWPPGWPARRTCSAPVTAGHWPR